MANDILTITLDKASYGADDGSTPLVLADFGFAFAANGGTATGWTETSLTKVGGVALTGGETVVEAHGTLGGIASSAETVTVTPASATSVYDVNGNAMSVSESIAATMKVASIIVMKDNFVGTTIDTAKWGKTDPSDGVTITQNDDLIFTVTGVVASSNTNNVLSNDTIDSGALNVLIGNINYTIGNDSSVLSIVLKDPSSGDQIYITRKGDSAYEIKAYIGAVSTYTLEITAPIANARLKLVSTGTECSFWEWTGLAWTQRGTTQTISLGTGLKALIGCNGTTADIAGLTAKVSDVYLTNSDYSSELPS